MSRQSSEEKLANAIVRGLNVLDLNVDFAAGMVSQAGAQIQIRLFKFFMRLVEIWARRYDQGEFDGIDEYTNVLVYAKRIDEIVNIRF